MENAEPLHEETVTVTTTHQFKLKKGGALGDAEAKKFLRDCVQRVQGNTRSGGTFDAAFGIPRSGFGGGSSVGGTKACPVEAETASIFDEEDMIVAKGEPHVQVIQQAQRYALELLELGTEPCEYQTDRNVAQQVTSRVHTKLREKKLRDQAEYSAVSYSTMSGVIDVDAAEEEAKEEVGQVGGA